MEDKAATTADGLSASKKIFHFFYGNAKNFFSRIAHSALRPKSYAQTIKIGDENDFFESLKFLFASISFYLTLCSIFVLISPSNVKLQLNANDFIHFVRLITEIIFIGLCCYCVLYVLTKQKISFTNFLHSWFHVSAISVFTGLVTLLMLQLFYPPLGENAQLFFDVILSGSEEGRKLIEQCKQDANDLLCRSLGTAGSWAMYAAKTAIKYNIIDSNNNNALYVTMMTGIVAYVASSMLYAMVFVAWVTYVQARILSGALHISLYLALFVIVFFSAISGLLISAFPELAEQAGYLVPDFT